MYHVSNICKNSHEKHSQGIENVLQCHVFFQFEKSNAYLHLNEVQNDKRQILNTVGSLSVFGFAVTARALACLFSECLCVFSP